MKIISFQLYNRNNTISTIIRTCKIGEYLKFDKNMLKIHYIIFFILIIVPSCKNTSTSPIQSNLSMEIIPYQDAPSIVDSNL